MSVCDAVCVLFCGAQLVEESASYQVLRGRAAEASCTLQRIFDLNRAHPRIWWRNDSWTAAMGAVQHEVNTIEVRAENQPAEAERGNLLHLFIPKYRFQFLTQIPKVLNFLFQVSILCEL